MIRTCDGTDPNLRRPERSVGNCGLTFDDVYHWTICPHNEIYKPPPEELERLLRDVGPTPRIDHVRPVDW